MYTELIFNYRTLLKNVYFEFADYNRVLHLLVSRLHQQRKQRNMNTVSRMKHYVQNLYRLLTDGVYDWMKLTRDVTLEIRGHNYFIVIVSNIHLEVAIIIIILSINFI